MRYFTFICVLLLIDAISFHLFPGGAEVKVSACSVGDPCLIPGSGRSPEKEMATHLVLLPRLQSMGLQRVGHD